MSLRARDSSLSRILQGLGAFAATFVATLLLADTSVAIAAPPQSAYTSIVAGDSPILDYRLDDPAGATVVTNDGISGSSFNGQTVGGVTLGVPGIFGSDGAASFDGSSGTISVRAPGTTIPRITAFSIEAWFETSSAKTMSIASVVGVPGGIGLSGGTPFGVVTDSTGATHTVTAATPADDGRWHYLTLTDDGARLRLYLDGRRVGTLSVTGTAIAYDGSRRGAIGSDGSGHFYLGSIDEPALYDYALAPAIVKSHFTGNPALTVSLTGTGSVTSLPSGIACPTTCQTPFPFGSTVSLSPGTSGGIFNSWGGDCAGTTTPCALTMTTNHAVIAGFGVSLFPVDFTTRVLEPFTRAVAYFLYPARTGATAADFGGTIAWGDGSQDSVRVQQITFGAVATFLLNHGLLDFEVLGSHSYTSVSNQVTQVSVGYRADPPVTVSGSVTVDAFNPLALFYSDPAKPSNGDIAMLAPVPPSPVQRSVVEYDWTFSDGRPVVDNSTTQARYITFLRQLQADPGNLALQLQAQAMGIMPPESDPAVIRQIADVWLQYFPAHMIPHIYPSSGSTTVMLRVTDSAGQTSTYRADVPVSDKCLQWGGGGLFGWNPFAGYTTCDTLAGFQAVVGGPQRRPDYYSWKLSGSQGIAGLGASVTVTHDGTVYVSGHGDVGVHGGFPLAGSLAFTEGFVGPPNGNPPPDPAIDSFVDGLTIPVAAQLGAAGLTLIFNPSTGGGGEEYTITNDVLGGSLSLGGSCSFSLGHSLPSLSALAPSGKGPWPDSGAVPPPNLTKRQQGGVLLRFNQLLQELQSCGLVPSP